MWTVGMFTAGVMHAATGRTESPHAEARVLALLG